MAPQRARSSCHSRCHAGHASVPLWMVFSTQMSNNIAHLAEGVGVDAVNREEAMRHEFLAHEQCHHQQANERERTLREETVTREEKMRADVLAREELPIRSQSGT